MAATTSTVEDLKNEEVPQCLYWTVDQVVDWIDNLGFPYYKACFATNLINGRKLVNMEAKALPSIGITDFEHIKIITKNIRDMLNLEEPDWTRSISLPPRNELGMYIEQKSGTGKNIDCLTFNKFLLDFKDAKWRPTLANHCLILPQC